jgi:hypothetical protein
MKIIIALALTLAAFAALHTPILKKKKGIVLALYAIAMILFFGIYNFRTIGNIIKTYHPTDQSIYQPEFISTLEYPDAFLDEFLKGKTVYTPDDARDVSDDIDVNDDCPEKHLDDYYLYYYYHAVNMWSYFDLNKAKVVKDASLNDTVLSDEQKAYYTDLGPANDMLRYIFPMSPYKGEYGNGFYHYWFYSSFIGDSRVYICTEDLADADELVCIWQHEDWHDTDSYYIASREYYDGGISK